MKRSLIRALVVGFVSLGLTAGTVAVFAEAQAGPCRCPLYYAPVICDKGRTYPNPCVADCHNAKNCVPTGDL